MLLLHSHFLTLRFLPNFYGDHAHGDHACGDHVHDDHGDDDPCDYARDLNVNEHDENENALSVVQILFQLFEYS